MFVDICLLTFMQIYVIINVIKEIEDKHRFVTHVTMLQWIFCFGHSIHFCMYFGIHTFTYLDCNNSTVI